jgi:hypothetical protein
MSAVLRAHGAAPISSLVDQLDEPLLYHDPSRGGYTSFFSLVGPRHQHTVHLRDFEEGLARMRGLGTDVYVAQNEFFRPDRKVVHCARLTSLYIDLDVYKEPRLRGWSLDRLTGLVELTCEDKAVPPPTVVVFSGQGLQLKWVLERPVPRDALPRWQAVQRELFRRFEHIGADKNALDASRVLRLVGTRSSRTGELVRVVCGARTCTMGGALAGGSVVYNFDVLAHELLAIDRFELEAAADAIAARRADDLADLQRSAQRRKAEAERLVVIPGGLDPRRHSGTPLVPSKLAWDRLGDLETLACERGWNAGVPDGSRDTFMFLAACFLADACVTRRLHDEVRALAKQYVPGWTSERLARCISAVVARAEMSARGEKVRFPDVANGPLVDARYHYSNAKLIETLEITCDEQKKLKTIIGADERRFRDRERKAAERRMNNAMLRPDYCARSQERAERARALHEQGAKPGAIAEALGISRTQVRKYLAR